MREVVDCKTPVIPNFNLDHSNIKVMYVLVEDDVSKTKVAYMGLVPLATPIDKRERNKMADWTAACGRKLTWDEAHIQFPSVGKRAYQR